MQEDEGTGPRNPTESHLVERALVACALDALTALAAWHHGSVDGKTADMVRLAIGVPNSWCPEGWTVLPRQFDPFPTASASASTDTCVSEVLARSGLTVLILFRSSPTVQEWQDLVAGLSARGLHSLYVFTPRTHPDSGGYEEEGLYSSPQIGSPQYTWDFGSVLGVKLLDEPTDHEDYATNGDSVTMSNCSDLGSASPFTVSGFRAYGWTFSNMPEEEGRRTPPPRAWAWLPYGPVEDLLPLPADLLPSLLSLHDRRRRSEHTHVVGVPLSEISGKHVNVTATASLSSERLSSLARKTFRRLPPRAKVRLKRHARRVAEWVVQQDSGLA